MRHRIGSLLATGRRRVAVVAVVGAALAGMLLVVSASLGAASAGPPRFSSVVNEEFFSTRALIVLDLQPERLATTWAAYDSESPSGPWTKVNEEELLTENQIDSEDFVSISTVNPLDLPGCPRPGAGQFLRGLKPGASYYARFVAVNSDGTAETVIPFKTLPVEKPEIDHCYDGTAPTLTSFTTVNDSITDTTAGFTTKLDANGAATAYHFEYAKSASGPWREFTSAASGTISASEEDAWKEARLSGLTPETRYYVRIKAENEKGETVQAGFRYGTEEVGFFMTAPAKPGVQTPGVRNVTVDSVHLTAGVEPHGSETQWRLEYTTEPGNAGSWQSVPGGSGTITQAQAEAQGYDGRPPGYFGAQLAGLHPSTTYYVRTFAQNAAGEGQVCETAIDLDQYSCEPAVGETGRIASFTTEGPPSAVADIAHGVHGEALRLLGSVNPNSAPTADEKLVSIEGSPTGGSFTLTLEGQTTAAIAYGASAPQVAGALNALATKPEVSVEGGAGGPYDVVFPSGVSVSQMSGDGSGLMLSGSVKIETLQAGSQGYDTHYHFEYASEASFGEHGWEGAGRGPEEDAGAGTATEYVGLDLPTSLTPGETYRYRMVAQSNAPGSTLVKSEEHTLTVPAPPVATSEGCTNGAFRVEASAHLPDCRAYEQLTPVDKHGAQEPFKYGFSVANTVPVGEDGEHAVLYALGTNYLAGPETGQSPFLFSREAGGWGMLTGAVQPETGVRRDIPQAYSSDATRIAFASEYGTSDVGESPDVEYRLGPIGGPYETAASIPRGETSHEEGWVAGTPTLSKLVLATRDRTLTSGEPTPTKNGSDLYEYTEQDGLRQLNVTEKEGETVTIGACGAKVARGLEDQAEQTSDGVSSPHSLSADGSRVFFEAVPGKRCGSGEEAPHLYMRVSGTETVDVGAYRFLAANADGSRVLIESEGGAHEIELYDGESHSTTTLPGLNGPLLPDSDTVASSLAAVYFYAGEALYRYDISAGRLEFIAQASPTSQGVQLYASADGRYAYFEAAGIGGLPGGSGEGDERRQVFRYDSQEHAIECISCASPFNPEPKLGAFLSSVASKTFIPGGGPLYSSISGNGQYAFFTTPAALVSQDIDGEVSREGNDGQGGLKNGEFEDVFARTSPSSDIYEWRAAGVHGCAQLDGCLSLITNGEGGYMSLLLGTADEGRDVFIYTSERLLPALDHGSEGNIFDVREDGGFAGPPPRPTECEADSCANPPVAPNDATPSSLTFSGSGNVAQPSGGKATVKKKKRKRSAHHARRRPRGKRGVKRRKAHASRRHARPVGRRESAKTRRGR